MKFFFLLFFLCMGPLALAAESTPIELQNIGVEERLGKSISLETAFVDESGTPVMLQHYFDGTRPVILAFVYYECPNLCTLLLNGLTSTLRQFAWTPGERYQIVTVSIDARETAEIAAAKKDAYLQELKRPEAAGGWHFLTGKEADIQRLAKEAGFSYRYDEDQGQFAHAAALIVLTPDGRISRYLYGIQFEQRDLKLALLEASEGKIGNIVDRLLLYCYHYDPKGRTYALIATNIMKLGGGLTVAILIFFLYRLALQYRRKTTHAGTV